MMIASVPSPTSHPSADRLKAEALAWLRGEALPLWLEHGVDWRAGAFHEHLHLDTLACRAEFRRLRVAARQTYVFARASLMGVPRAEEATALGVEFLLTRARQPDGGYARSFGLDNEPLDQTRDLYDHSFVLLAFSHAARVLRSAELREAARALLDYIEAHFRDGFAGYREAIPDQLPRRQNPHMHLLEAVVAAHAVFGEGVYRECADRLVALLLDRLYQREEGVLCEFFDERFGPLRDERGRFTVEPGHHFEWVWLLGEYRKMGGGFLPTSHAADVEAVCDRLFTMAEAHGVDAATGLAYDELHSDGSLKTRSSRLWPQTERLKALACRPAGEGALVPALEALRRYRDGVPPGLWHERLLPDGGVTGEPAPASSLYHLTCAIEEACKSS